MSRFAKLFLIIPVVFVQFGCDKILEPVNLRIDNSDQVTQEEFEVIDKTLTLAEARVQNKTPYNRILMQTGPGASAKLVSEKSASISSFPRTAQPTYYEIGIGDTIKLTTLLDNGIVTEEIETQWPPNIQNKEYQLGIGDEVVLRRLIERPGGMTPVVNDNNLISYIPEKDSTELIAASGRIGSDGSVLLLDVGRLIAKDKTLNSLRSEVRNTLIRNGESPRFQLEIIEFRSQRAYLTINSSSRVITLNDQPTTLRDVVSVAGKGLEAGIITNVTLQRGSQSFRMKLRDILSQNAPNIIIKNLDHIFIEDSTSLTNISESIVGHDGNIILAGVGKIKAVGRTIAELRQEILLEMNTLPSSKNDFQVTISKFSSKTALINIPGKISGIIQITDKPLSLDEILTKNGVSLDGSTLTRINLYRSGDVFTFTFNELMEKYNNKIYVEANDRITVDFLAYKPNKVFILGGVTPTIINIDPTTRETLADILFTPAGALSSTNAKRSEVYLLRGKNPIKAFHLDAQNPTRLLVANAMELRPNDILFVAEQPISMFNRTLVNLTPLRLLLRDIQDDNLP